MSTCSLSRRKKTDCWNKPLKKQPLNYIYRKKTPTLGSSCSTTQLTITPPAFSKITIKTLGQDCHYLIPLSKVLGTCVCEVYRVRCVCVCEGINVTEGELCVHSSLRSGLCCPTVPPHGCREPMSYYDVSLMVNIWRFDGDSFPRSPSGVLPRSPWRGSWSVRCCSSPRSW